MLHERITLRDKETLPVAEYLSLAEEAKEISNLLKSPFGAPVSPPLALNLGGATYLVSGSFIRSIKYTHLRSFPILVMLTSLPRPYPSMWIPAAQ